MTDNLKYWERFADIDPKYTKPITGKPYKGTSPNPQYVIKCLTEMFGPVGQGFGWDVVAEDFTPMGDELLHWCRIRFWHTDRANTFDSYGQTKAIMKTRNGLMSDEDAPKKSLTDAIIKAASHVGVAANIFLGRWDDQKYVAQVDAGFRAKDKPDPKPEAKDPRKIADSLIDLASKAETLERLEQLQADGSKFSAAWDWLELEKPPMAAEIRKAVDERKAELARILTNQGAG